MEIIMENQIIQITDKALQQIKSIRESEKPDPTAGLRLAVIGGGCSGLSYKIEFSAPKEKDNIQVHDDVKIFVDPKSSIYLKGIVLDFKDGLNGKGFVFENPNAKNTCGCGESFSV
jgi:iron-sulfur cluster assembly protein